MPEDVCMESLAATNLAQMSVEEFKSLIFDSITSAVQEAFEALLDKRENKPTQVTREIKEPQPLTFQDIDQNPGHEDAFHGRTFILKEEEKFSVEDFNKLTKKQVSGERIKAVKGKTLQKEDVKESMESSTYSRIGYRWRVYKHALLSTKIKGIDPRYL